LVSDLQHRAKRPVSTVLAGPYGHPFHPILVTVPIGAWVSSLIFDLSSHVIASPAFLTSGSQWLITIGILGAAAAAMIGLLDFFAIPTGTRAFRLGLVHMTLNLLVTSAYVVNLWWRHASDDQMSSVPIGQLLLSLVSLATLSVSGFLGGKLAYHYGVRVADEATQANGFRSREGTSTRP
jgi:uncharacterized membrane protein